MVIELSEDVEIIVTARAQLLGVSPADYIGDVLVREFEIRKIYA